MKEPIDESVPWPRAGCLQRVLNIGATGCDLDDLLADFLNLDFKSSRLSFTLHVASAISYDTDSLDCRGCDRDAPDLVWPMGPPLVHGMDRLRRAIGRDGGDAMGRRLATHCEPSRSGKCAPAVATTLGDLNLSDKAKEFINLVVLVVSWLHVRRLPV